MAGELHSDSSKMWDGLAATPVTASTPKPLLPQLTGLRIIAALWVVVFHMALPGGWLNPLAVSMPQWVSNVMLTGHCGVGLFFVLSGFILAYTYLNEDGKIDRRRFWLNRFARVYPIYLLSLLVLVPLHWQNLSGSGGVKLGLVAGLIQAWFPQFALYWNPPAWSLSAEAFFYAAFPFLLPYVIRLNRPVLCLLGAAIASAALVAASLTAYPELRGLKAIDDQTGRLVIFLRCNPLVRLPEFVMGICFAVLFARSPTKLKPWVPAVMLLVLIFGLAHLTPLLAFAGMLAPIFGLLILCLASSSHGFLSLPFIVKGGEISYAVYLLHTPVAHYFSLVGDTDAFWVVPLYLAVTLLVAWAGFEWVEEPCRKYIRRVLRERL